MTVRTTRRWTTVAALTTVLVAACAGSGGASARATTGPGPRPAVEPEQVHYRDVLGRSRDLRIDIRPARTGSAPHPVVIWSHGGSTGRQDPDGVGRRWGEALTREGYVFVAIAHPGRSDAQRSALCTAVGAEDCSTFNPLHWDRPHDLRAVIDHLEVLGDVRLDLERIVYGGHSAGAFGVVTTAGMAWPYRTAIAPPADDRPVAFLVASPPGRAARDLAVGSFDSIDRPVLFISGDGDTTAGTAAADRRAAVDLVPATVEAVTVWIRHEAARHGVFDLQPEACERAGAPARTCARMVDSVARAGVAFADAVTAGGTFDVDGFRDRLDAALPAAVEVSRPGG
jgi:predicted dienelactone hydrolase